MVWTEIVAEDLCVIHIAGRQVIQPIGDDVPPSRAIEYKQQQALERQARELKEQAKQLREQREMRERLHEAGYDYDEIPL